MTRELLFSITRKDFDITYFCAGGKGGQKQNKTASAARVRHAPSGAVAESRKHREQLPNKRAAWKRCVETPKFQTWLKKEIARANLTVQERRRLERELQDSMAEDKIQVEVRVDGKWIVV
jgi:protein subunit release factor B